MRALADARIPFSAGALNIGDSDHTLALRLAHDVITEQPYAPISPVVLEQVRLRLTQVAVLILCPVPVGSGNLPLLSEAVDAAQRGVTTLLLAPGAADADGTSTDTATEENALLRQIDIAARDYTGGEGVSEMRLLIQYGARVVSTVSEVVNDCQEVIYQ
jgi:iron complex transport system ATP-binding protein